MVRVNYLRGTLKYGAEDQTDFYVNGDMLDVLLDNYDLDRSISMAQVEVMGHIFPARDKYWYRKENIYLIVVITLKKDAENIKVHICKVSPLVYYTGFSKGVYFAM